MADIEFISDNGIKITITVHGYEFPDISNQADSFDKNWLITDIVVSGPGFTNRNFGPSLTTSELQRLADNITDFKDGKITEFELAPIEPYFDFKISADESAIFPATVTGQIFPGDNIDNKFTFTFKITETELNLAQTQIIKTLQVFPIRK